jgi:hypothetical protein
MHHRIYLAFFYRYIMALPTVYVAIRALPETLTFVPTLLVVALIIRRSKKYRWANIAGWSMTTLGFGLLYLMKRDQLDAELVLINIVPGVGLGLLFAGLAPTIQAAVNPTFRAHATSMAILMRSAGQALGVAIGGTIFDCHFRPAMNRLKLGDAYELVDRLTHDRAALNGLSEGTRVVVLDQLEFSVRPIWLFGCVLAAVMTIAMSTLHLPPLNDSSTNELAEQESSGRQRV